MAINILSFPLKALNEVCLFLSNEGLMNMRQICKSTKAAVDNLYCIQDPVILYVEVFELTNKSCNERVSITALFKSAKHSLLWKFCVLSAKSKLNLKNLFKFRGFKPEANIFDIVERIEDAIMLLAHLKQFFQRSKINRIGLKHTRVEICRAFENFLGEISVNIVELLPNQGQMDESLYCLLRNCQVKQVQLTYTYSPRNDCFNSIVRIANFVDVLTIKKSGDNAPKLPLTFIHDLLSRKCKKLCMIGWHARYSGQEITKFVQILHMFDKKICLTARTERTNEMVENIGLYCLDGYRWYAHIKHLEFSL